MPNYKWKLPGLAKNVRVEDAIEVIDGIKQKFGEITPDRILKVAENPKSPLHSLFEWNDTDAARQYRLQQARTIINNIEVVVVSNGECVNISSYEIIKTDVGNSYKSIETFTPDDIHQVRSRTVKELNVLRIKLAVYKNFSKVISLMDEVIKEVENTNN